MSVQGTSNDLEYAFFKTPEIASGGLETLTTDATEDRYIHFISVAPTSYQPNNDEWDLDVKLWLGDFDSVPEEVGVQTRNDLLLQCNFYTHLTNGIEKTQEAIWSFDAEDRIQWFERQSLNLRAAEGGLGGEPRISMTVGYSEI